MVDVVANFSLYGEEVLSACDLHLYGEEVLSASPYLSSFLPFKPWP